MSRILIGNVRDKLVNNLLATKAGIGALDAAQGKVLKDLVESVLGQQADTYSKKTYAVGDYCIYENALYKCNTAISSAEEWTAGHWTKTTIAAELKNIVGSVATVNNAITELNGKTGFLGKCKIENIEFRAGGATNIDSMRLKMPTNSWAKVYALIIGRDNIKGSIFEVVSAHIDDNANGAIKVTSSSQSTISKTWSADNTGRYVYSTDFLPYAEVTVLYYGFKGVEVRHLES